MPTIDPESVPTMLHLEELDQALRCEHLSTADVVARIAVVDANEAYGLRGYDSMHAYAVGWCHLSEDGAYRRIHVARAARRFPCLLAELRENRLNLSAICLLAPHLTAENHVEFVGAARHRTNAAIRQWLVEKLWTAPSSPQGAARAARQVSMALPRAPRMERVLIAPPAPAPPPVPAEPDEPIEFERRFLITREQMERFRYAQALLGHRIPSGDVAEIYGEGIEALIAECEKRKFGGKGSGRAEPESGEWTTRHIPAPVRRAVWTRDAGRCTHVAGSGQRCGTRHLLEFDHAVPRARGGPSTVANVRLRCRAHNQDEAKRTLGNGFMKGKRRRAAFERSVGRGLPAP